MSLISVETAIQRLLQGDVVAVPTETVYGLAGLIRLEAALKKIFAVKERPLFDPLIVHVKDVEQARSLTSSWPAIYDELAKKFWPGPLTLVTPKQSKKVSDLITAGLPSVALRCPRHPLALEILRAAGPFAAPSANRFGKTSPTAAAHVIEEFKNQVGVVDGGPCEKGIESTVVGLDSFKAPQVLRILRPGLIAAPQLTPLAAAYGLSVEIAPSTASPGHLPHHYQPEVPLVLLKNRVWNTDTETILRETFPGEHRHFELLTLPASLTESARRLYSELRKLSKDLDTVIVWQWMEFIPEEEQAALLDRLTRAASLIL